MLHGMHSTEQRLFELNSLDTKFYLTGSHLFWNRIGKPYDFFTKARIEIAGFERVYNKSLAQIKSDYPKSDLDYTILNVWFHKKAKIYIYQIDSGHFSEKITIQHFLKENSTDFQFLLKTLSHKFIWETLFNNFDKLDETWCNLLQGNNEELAALDVCRNPS